MKQSCVLVLSLCLLWNSQVRASSCHAENDATVMPLLELYTSEGCSSCPPAEQWLSHLKLASVAVNALAYHVDYWDGLGWKDRFAQPTFSAKQRLQAAQTGSALVYTPQFTLNGDDFRGWSDRRLHAVLALMRKQPAPLQLTLRQYADAAGQAAWQVSVTAAHRPLSSARLWLVLYQHGLQSQVQAGENGGQTLWHDFVVLQRLGPYSLDDTQALRHLLPAQAIAHQASGAVAYVQAMESGAVLQSLNLPVCHPAPE